MENGVGKKSPSWITSLLWRWGLFNSKKLWAMLCRATQDRQVKVESLDKMWSTGGGNGRPFQYSESHENPMNGINGKRKDVININYNLYLGLSLSLSLFSQCIYYLSTQTYKRKYCGKKHQSFECFSLNYELFFFIVYVFLIFQIIYNSCLCFLCFSIYFYWQNKKNKLKW